MYFIGYFLLAATRIVSMILTLYLWIIIARAVLSWVNPDPYNPIVRFIHNVTEPVLRPVRQRLPISYGGIDFSPMVVLLAIMFVSYWLVPSLENLGRTFLR
jgi:YggT family protein